MKLSLIFSVNSTRWLIVARISRFIFIPNAAYLLQAHTQADARSKGIQWPSNGRLCARGFRLTHTQAFCVQYSRFGVYISMYENKYTYTIDDRQTSVQPTNIHMYVYVCKYIKVHTNIHEQNMLSF